MIEREFTDKILTSVVEIVEESRKLNDLEYEDWKVECLNNAKAEKCREFMAAIINVVDKYRALDATSWIAVKRKYCFGKKRRT